jgi:hypothetical protein
MPISSKTKAHNPVPLYSLFLANVIPLVGNIFTMIAIQRFRWITLYHKRFIDPGHGHHANVNEFPLITTISMAFNPAIKEMDRKTQASSLL